MLEVTDNAKKELHKSLAVMRDESQHDRCFRLVPSNGKSLALSLSKPASSDSTFDYDGQVVLALPKKLHPYLQNRSLDVDDNGKLRIC
jgi:hypothetical protein